MLKHALLLSLSLMVIVTGAEACTCIGQENVQQARKRSDAVVVGKVISAVQQEIAATGEFAPSRSVVMRYSVLVERSFKGRIRGDTMIVYTGVGNGDCGYGFEEGHRYVIYGSRDLPYNGKWTGEKPLQGKNTLWTNICTRTRQYDESEIKELERLK